MNYLKFELVNSTLAQFAELSAIAKKEGAVSVSLLTDSGPAAAGAQGYEIALQPEGDCVAIKVPTLDGTEIWLGAKSAQPEIEKAAGFDRPSVPLLTFNSASLRGLSVLDPISGKEETIT